MMATDIPSVWSAFMNTQSEYVDLLKFYVRVLLQAEIHEGSLVSAMAIEGALTWSETGTSCRHVPTKV